MGKSEPEIGEEFHLRLFERWSLSVCYLWKGIGRAAAPLTPKRVRHERLPLPKVGFAFGAQFLPL